MALYQLDRGAKVSINTALYEREIEILDGLCVKHNASRATIIGELLMEYHRGEAMQDVSFTPAPGRRGRKSSL